MWTPIDERFQPPTEPRVSANCTYCGGEIYVGDELIRYMNGDATHEGDCENGYVAEELGIMRTIAE
ncbi:hypothetical protein MKX34_23955 [Paenibacillus sp. FSL R5-0636]|uniref:hypothetical protein n=1 Tax=Paenibacillus TaxID=44249 RepID=UPI00096C5E9A|nr:hypothetical protein [Paenibacillus odorifer]OMC96224.1 hypothetical protein BJP49_11010 [Paenibacillus odorifer]